ncbi:MAG: hypothetical protein Q8R29_00900 [bacterium]|nr:hypothetical protein [bacterium]
MDTEIFQYKFKPTRSLRSIVEDSRRINIFELFEQWPVLEVRQACLKIIKEFDGWSFHPESADWAEECIKDLAYQQDPLAEEILAWYVFAPQHQELAVRALEFAISLEATWDLRSTINTRAVSKIVCGRICNRHWILYPHVPSLPAFIHKLLSHIKPRSFNQSLYRYIEYDWHCAERALRMIRQGKDFSFLPAIEELILLFQDGITEPSSCFSDPAYDKEMHLADLKTTRKILQKSRRGKK